MENEKVCINLAAVEIGKIDVLVAKGLFTSRTDLIRSGIRRILDENGAAVDQVALGAFALGMIVIPRFVLEEAKRERKHLTYKVIGILTIDDDVSPDLAAETIHDVRIFGSIRGPQAVLTRLGPRIKRGLSA